MKKVLKHLAPLGNTISALSSKEGNSKKEIIEKLAIDIAELVALVGAIWAGVEKLF